MSTPRTRLWRWFGALMVLFMVINLPPARAQGATLANVGLGSGWATFGLALPQGAARQGVRVGSLNTQNDIKTRWPDGSIRFVILTVWSPGAGNYGVTAAAPASGSFTPASLTANVQLTLVNTGQVYTAALPASFSGTPWLSGPLVVERRATVAPTSGGQPHPFLRVLFDLRSYQNGQARLDVTVENVLNLAGAGPTTYHVKINIAGQERFSVRNVTHFYLTRWRKVFGVGLEAAQVRPDFEPFYRARALPRFLPNVANWVDDSTGPQFNLLQVGDLSAYMPAYGGRQEIAPYPDWTVRYLVHKDASQGRYVLAHGDLAGSWPVHLREASDGRLVSIDQRPNFWLDERAEPGNKPAGDLTYPALAPTLVTALQAAISAGATSIAVGAPGPDYLGEENWHCRIEDEILRLTGGGQSTMWQVTRGLYGTVAAAHPAGATVTVLEDIIPDNAHQPSLAYVPYLVTGDRYYADELAFWGDYILLSTWQDSSYPDTTRGGSQGLLRPNEVRGIAWGLRNMADAAAYLPDGDPMKAYLAQKVANNLAWLDSYAAGHQTPLGTLWEDKRPENDGSDRAWIATWEQHYLAWAIDHANKQGFTGGLTHRDRIVRFQVQLMSSPEFPREYSMPYILAVGWRQGETSTSYYTTFRQVYENTYPPGSEPTPIQGWYGVDARLMLLIAIENGWPGAAALYDWLHPILAQWPFIDGVPDLVRRAGWAIAREEPRRSAFLPLILRNRISSR